MAKGASEDRLAHNFVDALWGPQRLLVGSDG